MFQVSMFGVSVHRLWMGSPVLFATTPKCANVEVDEVLVTGTARLVCHVCPNQSDCRPSDQKQRVIDDEAEDPALRGVMRGHGRANLLIGETLSQPEKTGMVQKPCVLREATSIWRPERPLCGRKNNLTSAVTFAFDSRLAA